MSLLDRFWYRKEEVDPGMRADMYQSVIAQKHNTAEDPQTRARNRPAFAHLWEVANGRDQFREELIRCLDINIDGETGVTAVYSILEKMKRDIQQGGQPKKGRHGNA